MWWNGIGTATPDLELGLRWALGVVVVMVGVVATGNCRWVWQHGRALGGRVLDVVLTWLIASDNGDGLGHGAGVHAPCSSPRMVVGMLVVGVVLLLVVGVGGDSPWRVEVM